MARKGQRKELVEYTLETPYDKHPLAVELVLAFFIFLYMTTDAVPQESPWVWILNVYYHLVSDCLTLCVSVCAHTPVHPIPCLKTELTPVAIGHTMAVFIY